MCSNYRLIQLTYLTASLCALFIIISAGAYIFNRLMLYLWPIQAGKYENMRKQNSEFHREMENI